TLARADAGEYPLRPRDFYLEELAADCVRAVRSMAAARGIMLTYEPDGEMPIHADEALVRRLAMNLLDNAIKYTPAGGKISVACQRAGAEYSLMVRDSGPGMPAHEQRGPCGVSACKRRCRRGGGSCVREARTHG